MDSRGNGTLDVNLKDLLLQRRASILTGWSRLVRETYSETSARFMSSEKDRFANPVGYTISTATESLFDELLKGMDAERMAPLLDPLIRIKAVQEFSPAQAVSIVFLLKRAVREDLLDEILNREIFQALLFFESQIDELALLSFDIYMKCRERIYQLKGDELRRRTSRLLDRANRLCGASWDESDENAQISDALDLKGGHTR
ncbi:MAG: RsbRD N-terminal domain-containing protein [bacterium]